MRRMYFSLNKSLSLFCAFVCGLGLHFFGSSLKKRVLTWDDRSPPQSASISKISQSRAVTTIFLVSEEVFFFVIFVLARGRSIRRRFVMSIYFSIWGWWLFFRLPTIRYT